MGGLGVDIRGRGVGVEESVMATSQVLDGWIRWSALILLAVSFLPAFVSSSLFRE